MYFIMYTYSYFYINYDYDTGFYVMVMLRSITGPYGRPMIEVAYGEMILSLHRGCIGDDSSEKWLGCRHDASFMFDIPGSTPMWAQNILFSGFNDIKLICIVFLKFIYM